MAKDIELDIYFSDCLHAISQQNLENKGKRKNWKLNGEQIFKLIERKELK